MGYKGMTTHSKQNTKFKNKCLLKIRLRFKDSPILRGIPTSENLGTS